ncbi:MAG TPA: heat-inducible transcriptional repressor HrcA, partial [Mariprofundaceae bacterium]|nr:heat-inducible transcriptional repressor HrcA [Mariprofundaceae bacterium]
MKERHQVILNEVVKAYLETGQPVGSRMLSTSAELALSSASIRNAMNELERLGMLYAPHTSAGRIPTDMGLRYFVDSLMIVSPDIRRQAEQMVASRLEALTVDDVLHRASDELAKLTHYAGLVSVAERGFSRIHKIELVPISSEKVLAVIVSEQGEVQNRLISRGSDLSDSRLPEISRRLSEILSGCEISQAKQRLLHAMEDDRLRIRGLTDELVQWADAPAADQTDLFVSGQRQLLDVPELSVVDTIRSLLTAFDEKETLLRLVTEMTQDASGVKVFIGSEHALVNMDQVSVVLA